jgi:5'-phosphate synthase pdxT subunit
MNVGVLALQGDFEEHLQMLSSIDVQGRPIRLPRDLESIDALIIPGGESTSISRLSEIYGLVEPLREFGRSGKPVWGTCAGAIYLARSAPDLDRPTLGLLDVTVKRNAFGRQVDSFEADLSLTGIEGEPFHAIFIRAPLIESVGPDVTVMGKLPDGGIVAVRQGNLLATAFHPELTGDDRVHRYFLSLAANRTDAALSEVVG